MKKIEISTLEELNRRFYELIWRPTKEDVEVLGARLRHFSHNLSYREHRDREALFRAIHFAENASGPAFRKEFWIREFEALWLPLIDKFSEDILQEQERELRESELGR